MAEVSNYKHYNKRDRRSVLEADFSKGMMSTDGVVTEGYFKSLINCKFEKETATITPRPGLRVSGVIFPNLNTHESEEFYSDNVVIKAVKQCIEDGVTYQQIILCRLDDEDNKRGKLWVLTASAFLEHVPLKFDDMYSGDMMFSDYLLSETPYTCYFHTVESPVIHDIYFSQDSYRRIEFPVGEFAYGNRYYFFGEDEQGNSGLFHTYFDTTKNPPRYEVKKVEPKEITVSEAVTYGYNMLLGDKAYSFINRHTSPIMQFEGILPYDPSTGELLMTPKKNQAIDLVCYYNVSGGKYDIIWESRETTASDWTLQKKETITFSESTELKLTNFHPQNKDIMFRVSAYLYVGDTVSDIVEKAMVVGFDFSADPHGAAKTLEPTEYDLTTCTGLENWKGRNVIWGLPSDPTIIFISDYDEPSYFPYPNNIVTFNEPVIHCVEFMDTLAVFTTDKLYQVTTDDGVTFKTTVIQSHLSIDAWDKHLIQPVRNMLFFKSGNYYYMMVPKAQSLTGELTCAPITTPITSFFDRFSVNVQNILKSTYGYTGTYELLTYYNFLDYDDIHNVYAYSFDNSQAVLHFDVIYNTVDRTWKVWVFESPNYIYPYKQEATRTGLLATTSLVEFEDITQGGLTGIDRIVQAFTWDSMLVRGCYLPSGTILAYDPSNATAYIDQYVLYVPAAYAVVENDVLRFTNTLIASAIPPVLYLSDISDFYMGYSKRNVLEAVKYVYDHQDDYYTFRNYQYIDTGYRDDSLAYKKRYREIQFQINNLDKTNIQFGMEYILDGSPRRIFYKYDVAQAIDEMDPDFGVVYIDSTPYLETDLKSIDLTNQWTLDQSLVPEVALWKIRVAVSGKGYAPRFKLYSRNEKRFELLNLNWISKFMHMR